MVRKMVILIFVAGICVALLCGCEDVSSNNLHVGLNYNIATVPSINEFSGAEYENYQYHFSRVAAAVYKVDGKEIAVDENDERLNRLLNFIAYSEDQALGSWQQGYVREEDISQFLSTTAPMLEVTFCKDESTENSTLNKTPKIIICGDSCLLFSDADIPWVEDGEQIADRLWPYAELILSEIKGDGYQGVVSYDGWGNGYWIDLLAYAGFASPESGS